MTTPARRQYLRIKKEHPDEVLLFRMGDFYETFDDDARLVARELEIALTSREMGRGQRVPLAGIPYHALEPYLARLVKKGYRVAICEQTSDPAESRGLVERQVVRIVTPGTVIEDAILDQKANNYLAAVIVDGDQAGLAYVDITTSEFATTQIGLQQLPLELGRLSPSELLVSEAAEETPSSDGAMVTPLPPDSFHREWARESLLDHFGVASLEAFGCEYLPLATRSAGAVIDYLERNQRAALSQITVLRTYSTESYMVLDPQTRRNLELFEGGRWAAEASSLLAVLDRTRTPMGGRLLRRWLGQPLLTVDRLLERQEAVAWFKRSDLRRERVLVPLEAVSDIERLINRIRGLTATPRDLVGLAQSLTAAPQIRAVLEEDDDAHRVESLSRDIGGHEDVVSLIGEAIADDPPVSIGAGQVIRERFSSELDELRSAASKAQRYIAGLEQSERKRTGIKSLKVGYNRVFGYYIEVTKPNLSQVPEDYVRRQTLVSAERFITPDMKEHESLILNAQERMEELESSLFRQVCSQIGESAAPYTGDCWRHCPHRRSLLAGGGGFPVRLRQAGAGRG